MIPPCVMGKRRKTSGGEVREVHPLVDQLTGAIINEVRKRGWNDKELKRQARRNPSILYGYRNGTRRSPSLIALNDFGAPFGLTLDWSDGSSSRGACGRPHVVSDFEKTIITMIRALHGAKDREDLERVIRDFVLARTTGSSPQEPTGNTPEEPEE